MSIVVSILGTWATLYGLYYKTYERHQTQPDHNIWYTCKTCYDPKGAVISVLDFSRAFYSVPMHPDSKWVTTMIIPQQLAPQIYGINKYRDLYLYSDIRKT